MIAGRKGLLFQVEDDMLGVLLTCTAWKCSSCTKAVTGLTPVPLGGDTFFWMRVVPCSGN